MDLNSPEFAGTSVVLAVPFCPGLRELEVLPRGSMRIASLLSRVDVPPGILLFSLCLRFYPVSLQRIELRAEDARFLEPLFLVPRCELHSSTLMLSKNDTLFSSFLSFVSTVRETVARRRTLARDCLKNIRHFIKSALAASKNYYVFRRMSLKARYFIITRWSP